MGMGVHLSPVSLLPAPPGATAASSLPSPRRDTYHGRAALKGRAGRRRRGPTSSGPWPRRERVVAEGAPVDDDSAPSLGLVTSNSGWPWRPAVSAEALGARQYNLGDSLRGGGVPGAAGYTLGAGGGAARGGRSLHLPGGCPLQDLCGQGGAARAVPGPVATGVSGGYLEPSAGSPSPAAQFESELARGCRFPTEAPVSSVSVVSPHG